MRPMCKLALLFRNEVHVCGDRVCNCRFVYFCTVTCFARGHRENGLIKRRSLSSNLACFLAPVILLWLAQGARMLLCKRLARSQAHVSPFQRQQLEIGEEERRKTAKTMQGKHITCISTAFDLFVWRWLLWWMICFLSGLEHSVEQSKKDYQTLKEESQCREKELTQVRSHV